MLFVTSLKTREMVAKSLMPHRSAALALLLATICFSLAACVSGSCGHYRSSATLSEFDAVELQDKSRIINSINAAVTPLGYTAGEKLSFIEEERYDFSFGSGLFPKNRVTVMFLPTSQTLTIFDFQDGNRSKFVANTENAVEQAIFLSYGHKITFTPVKLSPLKCALQFGP